MSKKANSKEQKVPRIAGVTHVRTVGAISEYRLLANDLTILYKHIPDTGVITTNITYVVGARDEQPGETGIAHMLEHMLFKPTKSDLKKKIDSGAMHFERQTGCILNANTWKDRTTYFFSYPKDHYKRALSIEADRMNNVVLSDTEFLPERGNVLSEFDMYFGDPEFALSVAMVGTAFHSHPYGHETIGFREDIEDYTAEKLDRFYKLYYRPDNATLMVIGDIEVKDALEQVVAQFGKIKNPKQAAPRYRIREPKQEGLRRVSITRPSNSNILTLGVRHEGFGTKEWLTAYVALAVLADGPESILQTLLVDSGKASKVSHSLEPTCEANLALLFISLAKDEQHEAIESLVLARVKGLTEKEIGGLVKKQLAHLKTDAAFTRASSLKTARELTEAVASGDWSYFEREEKLLASISVPDVLKSIQTMFDSTQMTIGTFIGTEL